MIQEARENGNRRRGRMTREITYQKVLLAVYALSDEDGLLCIATNARISQESGHSIEAVSRSLAEMERRGVVRTFDWRHGLSCRRMVLMDHPLAESVAYLSGNAYKKQGNAQWL